MRDFKYSQAWKISLFKCYLFLFYFPISFIKAEIYIQSPDITAKEILLNSLKLDGGIERLQSIKTVEGVSRLTLLDSTTISIVFKRELIPGSQNKRLTDEEIGLITQNCIPFTCEVNCGGIHLMKPLLLHSSTKTVNQKHRRVIYLEFCSLDLENG